MPKVLRPTLWVTIYETNRTYGGPEEGGWWYDYGTVLATVPFNLSNPIEREYSDGSYDNDYEDAIAPRESVWYDELSVNDAHTVYLIEQQLLEVFGPGDTEHGVGSVICTGVNDFRLSLEPGRNYPAERPHYE